MEEEYLVATVLISRPAATVWDHWTRPEAIRRWNIPFENWHCPYVENNMEEGGRFFFRMEFLNGSDGFDHKGRYIRIIPGEYIEYLQDNGKHTIIEFQQIDGNTILREQFEPEANTPLEMQQSFCQSVLERFKNYVESTVPLPA